MEDNAGSPDLIKTSFFDDPKDIPEHSFPLWTAFEHIDSAYERYCFISEDKLMEGKLVNKCKKKEDITSKYYVLYKDRLECFKVFF